MKTLLILFAVSAFAESPERSIALAQAKNNAKRLAEFNKLNAKLTAAQAEKDAFVAEWVASCSPGAPRNDGGCQPLPPVAPAPAPKKAPAKPAVEPSKE